MNARRDGCIQQERRVSNKRMEDYFKGHINLERGTTDRMFIGLII